MTDRIMISEGDGEVTLAVIGDDISDQVWLYVNIKKGLNPDMIMPDRIESALRKIIERLLATIPGDFKRG